MPRSWLENNKHNKAGMYKMFARKRRMERWIEKHGSSGERDRLAIEDWLKRNVVKICPPFGHGKPDD